MATKPGLTKQELEQVVADSTFVADYRFSVHDYCEGECTIYAPFQEKYVRPGGLVCGPVFMAAADMAMWLAIMTKLGRVECRDRRDENIFFEWGQKRRFLLHCQNSEIRSTIDLWSCRVHEWGRHAVDASYVYLCPTG